jgi:cytidine deaminase
VILEDDTVITGTNQENASYPLCMCAERVVLYAISASHPSKKIKKMAIVAHKKSSKDLVAATSCGACRQVMAEYETKQKSAIEVVMLTKESKWVLFPSVSFLLPFSFNQENLI